MAQRQVLERPKRARLLVLVVFASIAAPAGSGAPADEEFFETRIRPVLAKSCFACHTNSELGGLRVDSRDNLLKGGKSGPAVVPGKPEASLIIKAVSQLDERLRMPLAGKKLSQEEISDLSSWVKSGAYWPKHNIAPNAAASAGFVISPEQRAFWSFRPLSKPDLPHVHDKSWAKGPIDHFILARQEARKLQPVKAAEKRALIRRATFDLIGLPPSPDENKRFLDRYFGKCVFQSAGPAACFATLRRAVGSLVARYRPLCGR
jgi:mono/diheme cytochrome c family protein